MAKNPVKYVQLIVLFKQEIPLSVGITSLMEVKNVMMEIGLQNPAITD